MATPPSLLFLLLLWAFTAAGYATASTGDAQAFATTSFGRLIGNQRQGVKEFLGIPFAEMPLTRYAAPVPYGTPYPAAGLNATTPGDICFQNLEGHVEGAEDCLFLNLFIPDSWSPGKPLLPIEFFVHGGSFEFGSGSDPAFNGTLLALEQNSMVVTINYRLNNFGFLASAEQAAAGESTGNFGLQDQREALRWVRAQAASLGGDPQKIMLFGESAGAISVMLHVVAPRSRGLFSRVLTESGFPITRDLDFAVNASNQFAAKVGCSNASSPPSSLSSSSVLACLRGVSAEKLIAADEPGANPFTSNGWGPATDGVEFSRSALWKLVHGDFDLGGLDVVVSGSNNDEGTLFVYPTYLTPMAEKSYDKCVYQFLNSKSLPPPSNATLQKLEKLYPAKSGWLADNRPQLAALMGDGTFVCGTRFFLKFVAQKAKAEAAASATTKTKTYMYHFDYRRPGICSASPRSWGVPHASELPFVWNMPASLEPLKLVSSCAQFNGTGASIGYAMRSQWGAIAGLGQPAPSWPTWDDQSFRNIKFAWHADGLPASVESRRRQEYCDLWEDHYVYIANNTDAAGPTTARVF